MEGVQQRIPGHGERLMAGDKQAYLRYIRRHGVVPPFPCCRSSDHPDKAVPLSGGGVPAGKKAALRVLPPRGQRALRDMPAAP